jgi:ArsR family transcriptional regulator
MAIFYAERTTMKTAKTKKRLRLSAADYRVRAGVANALANANRLMIVEALARGEMCVCEIVEMLGCDQSTVSKHLTVLKNAGLVEDRREGQWSYYRLACPCLNDLFRCIEGVISAKFRRESGRVRGLG